MVETNRQKNGKKLSGLAIVIILAAVVFIEVFDLKVISSGWFWLGIAVTISVALIVLHERIATDIKSQRLPRDLEWDNTNANQAALKQIHNFVLEHSYASIAWYQKRKGPKRLIGLGLRVGTILLTTFAGLLPLMKDISQLPQLLREPFMTTIVLAIAALLLTLDRFGGFTWRVGSLHARSTADRALAIPVPVGLGGL